jgi:hypothetical protein
MNWLLDQLFGKRYREGWPRGVVPFYNAPLRFHDPELWERTKHLKVSKGIPIWMERHPELFT